MAFRLFGLICLHATLGSGLSSSAWGQFVADKSDAPIGNSSFDSTAPQVAAGYVPMWTNDGGATHRFPDETPGGTYVTGDFRLRTPANGASYVFDGQLILDNMNGRNGGLMYKGTGTSGVLTISDLVLAGGHIAHQNGTSDLFQLAGNITVTAPSTIDAKQGHIDVLASITGAAGLTIAATDDNANSALRHVRLLSATTLTSNVDVIGKLELGGTGGMAFTIGADGVNNSVTGTGWAEFNGAFTFDLSGAAKTLGASWTIADVAVQSFGSSFHVPGFTEINNVWINGDYRFTESTGVLSITAKLGDVNGDGFVDPTDYQIILAHLDQPATARAQGDLNGDGAVNLDDFAEWRLARAAVTSANKVVPEPVAVALALPALLGASIFRRGQSRRELGANRRRMRGGLRCACLLLAVALGGLGSERAAAQLSNPIPAPITKQGLRIQLDDVVQFPNSVASLGSKPDHGGTSDDARINFFRESPDGRYFVNDLRGQLYRLDQNNQPQLYVDLDANNGGAGSIFPAIWFDGGLAAGFISFTFHPEYKNNGLFYTIHMERAADATAVPDFATTDLGNPPQGVNWHTVVTEWHASDPLANAWNEATGSRRELLRVGTTASAYFHPYGDLQFNPYSRPGDADYGLLYLSGGDWGYINGAGAPQDPNTTGQPGQLQRLDNLPSSLIRIDPRSPSATGGQAGLGDYTIPADNPFVDGDPNTLDEIYAFGFRNGHRMAWDEDGTLYLNVVGHANLEEIERVIPGGNYGWGFREGTFVNGNDLANGGDGNADNVFANNVPDALDVDFRGQEYLYPVVQYDHGEGNANCGGFVYHGTMIPQLYGKYIFGDIVNGRMFAADVATMQGVDITEPGPTAPVEEIQLFRRDPFGVETEIDMRTILPGRVDLRLGVDNDGEIWVMTKEDGYLRRLVGPGPTLALSIDPLTGQGVLRNVSADPFSMAGYTIASHSGSLEDGAWNSLGDQGLSGWDESPNADATALSEVNPFGDLTLAPGEAVNLGLIFDALAGTRDLRLRFLGAGETTSQIGAVQYRPAADFNFDRVVGEADLAIWRAAYAANAAGDANGDNLTDAFDFLIWQREAAQASGLVTTQSSVPEPASTLLGVIVLTAVSAWRFKASRANGSDQMLVTAAACGVL